MFKVFVNGSGGTTGLRIHERLSLRPDLELLSLPEAEPQGYRSAGRACPAGGRHRPLPAGRREPRVFRRRWASDPCKVLDTSTAFRTDPRFAYGFPELSKNHEEAIRVSSRVANTGCHAAGAIALLYPLLTAGVIAADMPISITSITGYSGGGKAMIAEYEAEGRDAALDSPRAYALTQNHKHIPEIVKVCGLAQEPIFQPVVADFYNGMLVSVPLHASRCAKPADDGRAHGRLSSAL